MHQRGGGAAAVRDATEQLQVVDAHGARHFDLVAAVEGEGRHAVDVARRETAVRERRAHRLGRQPEIRATRVLGKIGGADADDGRSIAQGAHLSPPGASHAPCR